MLLQTDYRKLKAVLLLGLTLCLLGALAAPKLDGNSGALWTALLVLSGLLFISIGLLVRSKIRLSEQYLEISNLLGISKKRIALSDIKKVKYIQKEYPVMTFQSNPLWLFLWDKKFKSIKQLELFDNKKRIARIDGHYIQDADFETLRKKIK